MPLTHMRVYSRAQMPPTQKGVVGSVTSQERIPFARESEITGGSRWCTRGDSATDGWRSHAPCWCHSKSPTKRTPRQCECQFTGHKSQSCGQFTWVWVLGTIASLRFLFFFFRIRIFLLFSISSYTSRRRCTLSGSSCMLCAHTPHPTLR